MSQSHPRACSVQEAAKWLGLNRRTLQRWFADGAPVNPDGSVSVPALFGWRIERATSREAQEISAEARYRLAKAQREEIKLARERGQLVSAEVALAENTRLATRVRQIVLAWPRSLSERLIGVERVSEAETILQQAARDVLLLLADADLSETQEKASPCARKKTKKQNPSKQPKKKIRRRSPARKTSR